MFGNETYYTKLSLKQKSWELLPLGARVTSVHLNEEQLILVANRDLQDLDYSIIIMQQLEQSTQLWGWTIWTIPTIWKKHGGRW